MQSINIIHILDSLAVRFPVCMASDEFHYFPQAKAENFDWACWDDFSQDSILEIIAQLNAWERQISSHPSPASSLDQRIDLDMIARVLLTLREQFDLVKVQEIQPTFYLTIIGIGLAEAMESGSRAIKERSDTLPGFVESAIKNLTNVPRLFCEIGTNMLTEQQKWVQSLSLPEDLSTTILGSLQLLGHHLRSAAGAEGFLPDVALFERIATEHMGCRMKPEDIARELEMEIEETLSDLIRSTAALDSERSWQETIENLPKPNLPPEGLLEIYRKAIAELSRHCISIGMIAEELVEQCPVKVEPVPDYMKPVRNNAAYSMPPGHPPRGGTFYLQDTEGNIALPADYRLLAAHETFPGHHLLDTCRWRQERHARRHIEFPIFYEGWASFAEELMFNTGMFSGPVNRILMAKRRFWRALRGKVDYDIHTRRKTLDQAADLLVSHGMAPSRAGFMVRRFTLKPGYQLAYTIGRRKFNKLYATSNLKENKPVVFAHRILEHGEIGFDHLEKVLRQGDSSCPVL